tara:strand:+ start:255 stop:632 length:378 start_codon:yes stop_codon:yes gene_type:complete
MKKLFYILLTTSIIFSSCSKDSEYEGEWIGLIEDGEPISFRVDEDGCLNGEMGGTITIDFDGSVSEDGDMNANSVHEVILPSVDTVYYYFDFNGTLQYSSGSGTYTVQYSPSVDAVTRGWIVNKQ